MRHEGVIAACPDLASGTELKQAIQPVAENWALPLHVMSMYFLIRWQHNLRDEPVFIYDEVDDERYEARKVHEYGDGQLECTARVALEFRTSLSPEPVPPVADIDAKGEFAVFPLSHAEFEAIWDLASEVE